MTGNFRDLSEVYNDFLTLPIDGKSYRIPGASAETGLLCEQMMTVGIQAAGGQTVDTEGLKKSAALLDDGQETDLYKRILGPAYDEMIADKVSWPKMKLAGQTALFWITIGLETAESFWNSGGLPEAPAPANREERRASKPSAGAGKTKKRASTSGTSSRSTSALVPASRSRGGRSSAAGRQ